jgi:2-oxoglutarate dehydrogenase E1 component
MATKQTVQLLMPEMGESVTEGTVLEWHVSEGDSVEEGQTMVEVSTDKVDAEVPAPPPGPLRRSMSRSTRTSRSASRSQTSIPTAAGPQPRSAAGTD